MFIRFVIPGCDEDSLHRRGVFQAAYDLIERPETAEHHREQLRSELDWFSSNLAVPDRVARSSRAGAAPRAILWFKASAEECIGRVRAIAALLDEYGLSTEMLKCERPGYIVYEDPFQVAAEPFADTPA